MVKNILLACVLTAAGGYLLGSILFGVLISKVMYNDDVRNHGSGNAGMTNVLRTYGQAARCVHHHRRCGQERGRRQPGPLYL